MHLKSCWTNSSRDTTTYMDLKTQQPECVASCQSEEDKWQVSRTVVTYLSCPHLALDRINPHSFHSYDMISGFNSATYQINSDSQDVASTVHLPIPLTYN